MISLISQKTNIICERKKTFEDEIIHYRMSKFKGRFFCFCSQPKKQNKNSHERSFDVLVQSTFVIRRLFWQWLMQPRGGLFLEPIDCPWVFTCKTLERILREKFVPTTIIWMFAKVLVIAQLFRQFYLWIYTKQPGKIYLLPTLCALSKPLMFTKN